MSHVTEAEILSLMKTTIVAATEKCGKLAVLPMRGQVYASLRTDLKTIENCCRQVAYYRGGDARWLNVGMAMEKAHQLAGHWLRRHYPRPLFEKLADNLRALGVACADLETKATGRVGMILPKPGRTERTEGRPMQVMLPERVTSGGIIVPEGVGA